MAIFSALAMGHSLFLASYFWTSVKKSPSRFFLALLLTALAIRIIKSVIVILIPQSPFLIPAVGLIGLSAIGPSLYLYTQAFKNFRFKPKTAHLGHYVICMSLILIIPFFTELQMFIAYCATVAHMFIYLILSFTTVQKSKLGYKEIEYQWMLMLLGATALLWITFFAQLIIEKYITYLAVTIIASIVLYGLSIWASRKGKLFREPARNRCLPESKYYDEIGGEIEALFAQQVYTDSNLSVKSISEKLEQPEYLVSQAINFYFKMSFPELLNKYRVHFAAQLIRSTTHDNYSIEGIAYESGYNSISAFYRAFKKIKGVTPAQFKKAG